MGGGEREMTIENWRGQRQLSGHGKAESLILN